jgi:hypothetical protein
MYTITSANIVMLLFASLVILTSLISVPKPGYETVEVQIGSVVLMLMCIVIFYDCSRGACRSVTLYLTATLLLFSGIFVGMLSFSTHLGEPVNGIVIRFSSAVYFTRQFLLMQGLLTVLMLSFDFLFILAFDWKQGSLMHLCTGYVLRQDMQEMTSLLNVIEAHAVDCTMTRSASDVSSRSRLGALERAITDDDAVGK